MKDTILHGDCVELLGQLASESVHAVVSDIPYGIGYDAWDVLHANQNSALGGSSEAQVKAGSVFKRRGKPLNGWSQADREIPREYQAWCERWAAPLLRVLKPGGSVLLFCGRRMSHRCVMAMEDSGFTFKDSLAWVKRTAPHRAQRLSVVFERRGDKVQADRWQGWRLGNTRPLYEPIAWFQKPYPCGTTIADNVLKHGVGAWFEDALEAPHANVLESEVRREDSGLHPAQKPLALMRQLIELVTAEGQCVLDPFMGSGTTCVAAKQLKRHYIGIEMDKHHCDMARERLEHIAHD